MIYLIATLLGGFFLALIYISYKVEKDLFSPRVMFLLLEFISYVPGMFMFKQESSIPFNESGCLTVMIYEMIYVIFVLIGIEIAGKFKIRAINKRLDIPLSMILFFFLIGFIAKVIVINKLGGLFFVINNGQYAYLMQAHGFGIYTILYKFMMIAILALLEKCILYKDKKAYKILLIFLILIYAASFLIYTSRTPALILAIIGAFVYNYRVKKITIRHLLNARFIFIFIICIIAAYTATLSRVHNSNNISTSMVSDLIYNYTKIGRDSFGYDYFSTHDKWLGRGYLNIVPSLIPGDKSKPSTDDGIYLVNLMRGYNVDINDNSNELPSQSGSVPFSTPVYMYANFGVIGIIIGGIIMGLSIGLVFAYMIKQKNVFTITIYFYIIYSFGLSTGKLVPTLISCIFIIVFKKIMAIKLKFSIHEEKVIMRNIKYDQNSKDRG